MSKKEGECRKGCLYPGYDEDGKFHPFRMAIQAPSGGGKTHFLVNQLLLVDDCPFDQLLIFCHSISIGQDSYKKLEKDWKRGPIHFIDELPQDEAEGKRCFDMLQKASDKGQRTLVVLDDFQAEASKKYPEKWTSKLYTAGRHLKVSTCMLLQNLAVGSRKNRLNMTHLILFHTPQDARSAGFVCSQVGGTKERSQKLHRACMQAWASQPRGWVMFDFNAPAGSNKLLRCCSFDKAIAIDSKVQEGGAII